MPKPRAERNVTNSYPRKPALQQTSTEALTIMLMRVSLLLIE